MSSLQGPEGKNRPLILLVDDTEINRELIGGSWKAAPKGRARAGDLVVLDSLRAGIDEFITRPIAPGVLVDRVSQIIAKRGSMTNDWKPVWRLYVFAKFAERLDKSETEVYLDELHALLDSVAHSIDSGRSGANDFTPRRRCDVDGAC